MRTSKYPGVGDGLAFGRLFELQMMKMHLENVR